MQDKLDALFEAQGALQRRFIGLHPSELERDERAVFFKDMTLAGLDEAHEALAEVGWKPWASSRHFNDDAVKGELVDEFHFFMNKCMTARMTPQELFDLYMAKNGINHGRIETGYDGISGKCPGCKRAYDDSATRCFEQQKDDPGPWCAERGWQLEKGWAR